MLEEAGARTLIDVSRFPSSRRNPQFNQPELAGTLEQAGIAYRHAVELGGRPGGEPSEERFACIPTAAFRRYAARMRLREWQGALGRALAEPGACFMYAETDWRGDAHRRLLAEQLDVRGYDVVHLLRPGERQLHSSRAEVGERRKAAALRGAGRVSPPAKERTAPGPPRTTTHD